MTGIKLPFQLSLYEKSLHERALTLSQKHRRVESVLVATLEEIDRLRFFRRLGYSSLFTYAVTALQLSEATAYGFITVARKSREFPELKEGIVNQKLTVSKAARIVASLSAENAGELIEFASTHSSRETDRKVATLGGAAGGFADGREQLVSLKISRKTKELLKRARELLATKSSTQRLLASKKCAQNLASSQKRENLEMDQVLQVILDDYLHRHDPVKKAERAVARRDERRAKDVRVDYPVQQEKSAHATAVTQAKNSVGIESTEQAANSVRAELAVQTKNSVRTEFTHEAESAVQAADAIQAINSLSAEFGSTLHPQKEPGTFSKRRGLLAHEKHEVFARDGGRCTFKDTYGRRCESERWLHVHHIHPVSLGGGNQAANLTTLCSFHHDLVHQLSFSIEGQISWLREPERTYLN
jgi:5-methylcytosine-specific restriction endonuclease McrA